MASTLTISGDGQVAAAMDRDRNIVSFYDMKDGQLLRERSMGDKKMPSAFACNCDITAYTLLNALKEQGVRVSEDVSVVGFDDNELAVFADPALTTVAQPLELLGVQAIALAQRLIAGEPLSTQPLLLPTLMVRGSTAAPRH